MGVPLPGALTVTAWETVTPYQPVTDGSGLCETVVVAVLAARCSSG
ncbi:MAG: hypothetical protein MZV70_01045 [Desulfobacterales bacterium]|nr:hypothetical protein [Desulfobacterales bacterium]